MPAPKLNAKAPVFKGECTGNKIVSLSDLKGKNVVLYFYPKDSTPGCTVEAISFSKYLSDFTKMNCLVFGISKDRLTPPIKKLNNGKIKIKPIAIQKTGSCLPCVS